MWVFRKVRLTTFVITCLKSMIMPTSQSCTKISLRLGFRTFHAHDLCLQIFFSAALISSLRFPGSVTTLVPHAQAASRPVSRETTLFGGGDKITPSPTTSRKELYRHPTHSVPFPPRCFSPKLCFDTSKAVLLKSFRQNIVIRSIYSGFTLSTKLSVVTQLTAPCHSIQTEFPL